MSSFVSGNHLTHIACTLNTKLAIPSLTTFLCYYSLLFLPGSLSDSIFLSLLPWCHSLFSVTCKGWKWVFYVQMGACVAAALVCVAVVVVTLHNSQIFFSFCIMYFLAIKLLSRLIVSELRARWKTLKRSTGIWALTVCDDFLLPNCCQCFFLIVDFITATCIVFTPSLPVWYGVLFIFMHFGKFIIHFYVLL